MERRLMKHGDYVAELRFDKEDALFRARVVNLERDSLDFCASKAPSGSDLRDQFLEAAMDAERGPVPKLGHSENRS